MASELHVDAIKHSGGTSALTIDSSGNVHKAGMIVQVKETTTTGSISTTSTSYVASGVIVSITPKFQSSKFIIQTSGISDCHTGVGHNITAKVYQKIGSGSYSDVGTVFYQIYGDNFGVPHYGKLILTPNTTSELSYQVYYKSSSSNGVYINAYGGQHVIQVTEVAQ